jgi:putative membrane protein
MKMLGALALCAGATLGGGRASAQDMTSDAAILGHELAANQGEVQLGQWVSQHTRNAAVRAYADMLVRDHGHGAQQVQAVATRTGITPDASAEEGPRHDTQEIMDSLQALSGAAMDRKFIDHAVGDHRKDISDTRDAIEHAQNPAVRTLLEGSMPVLQTHLNRAEQLQAGMGGTSTGGGRRSMGVHKDTGT